VAGPHLPDRAGPARRSGSYFCARPRLCWGGNPDPRARKAVTQLTADAPEPEVAEEDDAEVEETLVEEVSIDGMCGVY